MTQDMTIDEVYVALCDGFANERDLYRRGLMALHLRDYERGDRSDRLRAKMSKLLAYRRSQR